MLSLGMMKRSTYVRLEDEADEQVGEVTGLFRRKVMLDYVIINKE